MIVFHTVWQGDNTFICKWASTESHFRLVANISDTNIIAVVVIILCFYAAEFRYNSGILSTISTQHS